MQPGAIKARSGGERDDAGMVPGQESQGEGVVGEKRARESGTSPTSHKSYLGLSMAECLKYLCLRRNGKGAAWEFCFAELRQKVLK